MRKRHVLSPRAQSDLVEIWIYTEARWGADQAGAYIRGLWSHMEDAAARPTSGRAFPGARAGYFRQRCGSHVLFYRVTSDGIGVVRILHKSMDAERHLPKP